MNTQKITGTINRLKKSAAKHSPEILTGIGITGMITSTVLAVKATPKALYLLDEVKQEKDTLTKREIVATTWKCYLPSVITGTISVLCLIEANTVNLRRKTALATAYTLSETAMNEYRKKVIETIGADKEQEISDEIRKDKLRKNPINENTVIINDQGDVLCYDAISGRYFKSDIYTLRKAENELNRRMMDEIYISLNELYDEIGLPSTKLGEELGWNIDRGLIELHFDTQLSEDDKPCIVVDYRIAPKYDFK